LELPRNHIYSLNDQIESHRARIRWLEDSITRLDQERLIHERIIEVAQNPHLLQVLSDLASDPDVATVAARDVESFRSARALDVLDGFDLSLEKQGKRLFARAILREHHYLVELSWDSVSGFNSRIMSVPDFPRGRDAVTGDNPDS
jgi:hypothetical protein